MKLFLCQRPRGTLRFENAIQMLYFISCKPEKKTLFILQSYDSYDSYLWHVSSFSNTQDTFLAKTQRNVSILADPSVFVVPKEEMTVPMF